MPDQTPPPPRSPLTEFTVETSTLAELRTIVRLTADHHPNSPIRVRIDPSRGAGRHGSALAAVVVLNSDGGGR